MDPLDIGVFELTVTGTTPVSTMTIPYSEYLLIDIVVTNECPGDIVLPTDTIADLTYKMVTSGLISYTPTWTVSVVGCPVTYEIRRVLADLSEVALTAFETAVLTLDSTDGSLDINSSDKSYDGEVWTIKIFKRSTYSVTPS